MQALIAASSLLQRERTALKLMLTLLVEKRETLRLGSVIPVGDLWDAIAAGDQPFSEGMRIQFENARKLWTQKLLPLLERNHDVTWQEMQAGRADPARAANLLNDARLLKTLLLAALVPEVEALRALTTERLAALNHGSVVSPIAGREGGAVLAKLRSWAAQVGEIKLTDDQKPVVSLQISGVDVEPILANVAHYDNDGNRRKKVREILFKCFGIPDQDLLNQQGFHELSHVWNGTKRHVDLWLESVVDLSDERLRGRRDTPCVILGLPFDQAGKTTADHKARLERFQDEPDTIVVVWLPAMFGERALKDLGTLLRIDYLLTGSQRLEENAPNLSVSDREQARALLRNQQSQLQQRMRTVLEAAYGIRSDQDRALEATLRDEEHLVSLDGTFKPKAPYGANLGDAIKNLLNAVYLHLYPAHPRFEQEEEVKLAALKKVMEEVARTAEEPDQRRFIEDKAMRRILGAIAGPLQLGRMGDTHFVLDDHWAQHFDRSLSQQAGEPVTVKRLRELIDTPQRMGLPAPVRNLVILAFAAQADRTVLLRGVPLRASIDRLDDEAELRAQPLPDETTWEKARLRSAEVFGLTPSQARKGATVERLAGDLQAKAQEARQHLVGLRSLLNKSAAAMGVNLDGAPRMKTLLSASALVTELAGEAAPHDRVGVIVEADLQTSEAAVARAIATAVLLARVLGDFDWGLIEALGKLEERPGEAAAAAAEIKRSVAEALRSDEHVVPLESVLASAQKKAYRLLAEASVSSSGVERTGFEEPLPRGLDLPSPGTVVIDQVQHAEYPAGDALAALEELRARLEAEPTARLELSWRLIRPSQ